MQLCNMTSLFLEVQTFQMWNKASQQVCALRATTRCRKTLVEKRGEMPFLAGSYQIGLLFKCHISRSVFKKLSEYLILKDILRQFCILQLYIVVFGPHTLPCLLQKKSTLISSSSPNDPWSLTTPVHAQ